MRTITALPLVLSLLAGCAVGPDFETPKAPDAAGYSSTPMPTQTASAPVRQGEAQTFKPGQDIAADWWHLFKSESLNLLVEQALANNPTLPAAQAALRVAHENTAAQRGLYLPQVSAQFSASRNLTPLAALSPASASGSPYYSLITPQLNVSFVPDVFGANRRAVEGLFNLLRRQSSGQCRQGIALLGKLLLHRRQHLLGLRQGGFLRRHIGPCSLAEFLLAMQNPQKVSLCLDGVLRRLDLAAQRGFLAPGKRNTGRTVLAPGCCPGRDTAWRVSTVRLPGP